jgi:hypothetical protein
VSRGLDIFSKWVVPALVFGYGLFGLLFRSETEIWGMPSTMVYGLGMATAAVVVIANLVEGRP